MPPPRRRLLLAVALALAVAALVGRTFTSGGGLELHQPGTQVLLDLFAIGAALACCAAAHAAGRSPWSGAGLAAPAALVFCGAAALAAARASHADLAWRSASTWTALVALGLTLRELGRDRRLARWLASLAVACVVVGALLGVHDAFVARPELRAQLEAGELDAALAIQDRGTRIALADRIRAVAAVGPWLLPNLLATAVCAALPLVALAAWRDRRRPWGTTCVVWAGALLLALAATRSKGGLLTALVVLGAGALLAPPLASHRRRLAAALAGLAAVVLAGGVALYLADPEGEGVGLSLTVRLEYWRAGLAMAWEHPLLGVGLNQFREHYPALRPLTAEETLHAHNAAVQVLAEQGLVGALALLGLLAGFTRAGLAAAAGAGADSPGGDATPDLERGVALASCAAGGAVALIVLAGFGDVVSAATPGALALVAVGVPLVMGTLAAALAADKGGDGRALAAATLAGAAALVGDGLLDFGLHHAGVFGLTLALAALAPALAGCGARAVAPRLGWALAGVLAVAGLAQTAALARGALEADVAREVARFDAERGLGALASGDAVAADAALAEAEAGYAASLEGYPWHARTHVARAQILAQRAALAGDGDAAALERAARAALRRAGELAPRAYGVWSELGASLLRARPVVWADALAALDRAVALYPGHPALLLDAARARAAASTAPAPPRDPAALRAEALELLARSERASAATRLVRLRHTPEARREVHRLRAALAPGR